MELPFVVLESADGVIVAEGALERRRGYDGAMNDGALNDGAWVGAISYDFGLPDHIVSPAPFIEVPMVDLFRPKRVYRTKITPVPLTAHRSPSSAASLNPPSKRPSSARSSTSARATSTR